MSHHNCYHDGRKCTQEPPESDRFHDGYFIAHRHFSNNSHWIGMEIACRQWEARPPVPGYPKEVDVARGYRAWLTDEKRRIPTDAEIAEYLAKRAK